MNNRILLAGLVAAAALQVPMSRAASGWEPQNMSLRAGYGDDAVDAGVHARWPIGNVGWLPGQPLAFAEGGLDYWHSTIGGTDNRDLVEFSAVGGLRWQATSPAWFVDVSFGPHLLSETQINDRRFSIALQFGARLAIGIPFGESRRHEIAGYIEHTSNARLAHPNNGMTFFGAEYRYTIGRK
jgi:hypothetical protein